MLEGNTNVMRCPTRFTFMCGEADRLAIAMLSERLDRTQSDAVRWVVREAARELEAAARAQTTEIQDPPPLVAA
jgi:hypothetical protein